MSNQQNLICFACNKNLNYKNFKSLQCSGSCQTYWHKSCANLSNDEYERIITNNKNWICEGCQQTTQSRREESTNNQASSSVNIPIAAEETSTTETVIDKLNLILQHQRKTDETINQMKQMLENYETKIKYLTDENDNLKSANQNLHKRLILTEDAINRMNQQQLSQNLEICGYDERNDENLLTIVQEIAQIYEVSINNTDIHEIRRKKFNNNPNNGLPAPIIVKFYNKQKRDLIMERNRTLKLKKNMLQSFNLANNNNEANNGRRFIYINEQLTKTNKFLFKKARDYRRAKKIERAWVRNGTIFYKITENGPLNLINNISDFDDIN
jgi:hypothetical protein